MKRLGQAHPAFAILALVVSCTALPRARNSPFHHSDADVSVTRILHGAAVIEMHDTRVLVDPWFHSGFWVRHAEPLGLVPDGLPSLSAVLITHRHHDHFDARALRDLAGSVPEAIAPAELHGRLVALGFQKVTDLDWWEHTSVGPITVTAVPARHGVPENIQRDLRQAYKILFRDGLSMTNALAKVEAELPRSRQLDMLVKFIKGSKRGVGK